MCSYLCQFKHARNGLLFVVLSLTQSGTVVRVGVIHSTQAQVQEQARPVLTRMTSLC